MGRDCIFKRTDEKSLRLAELLHALEWQASYRSGAGIMQADYRQVTTVFAVQPSFHHRHWTEYHEELPSSSNDEVRCDCTFADDGNAS